MDPLDYYALLKLADAPGTLSGPKCQYVQTPINSFTNTSTPSWGCPAGNFCLSPKHSAPCPPGFYCPPNTAQPMYCCAGYYCSEDTKTITLCPQNQYCPAGSVGRGTSCLWLASCPAGSSSASKFGLILFVIVFMVVICIVFYIHKRFEAVRTHHLEKRLQWIHNHNGNYDSLLAADDDEQKQKQGLEDTKEGSGRLSRLSRDTSNPDVHVTSPDDTSTSELTSMELTIQVTEDEKEGTAAGTAGAMPTPAKRRKRAVSKVTRTFDIEFQKLGLTLPNGTSILQNVSGILRSGRTCAIMGPSGSGKTTLISMLTSKIPKDEGRILINGQEGDLSYYRKLIGFVPQEDIMMRELTVHDVLLYSAYMRLPSDLKKNEMTEKVLEIIDFLGLNSVMDSVVGDAERRGISGGQRKRVNIGMELVTDPSILLLDEPTSGLDSSTSGDVCKLLRSVARRKGLTVAAVIHSPSPVAFNQFDDLLLLGQNGRVVFHGPRTEAPAYFAAIGFPVPVDSSPSDFYMDVISNNIKSKLTKKFKPFYLSRYWESYNKRAQSFYADPALGVEYRHPSHKPGSPRLYPKTSALLTYPSLNQSAISVQQSNGHGIIESLTLTDIDNMPSPAMPYSSDSANHGFMSSASSTTLYPSSQTQQKRNSQVKSVTMSEDPAYQRSAPSSPRPSMALSDLTSMYSTPPPPERLTFWETLQRSIRISYIESRMWWKGVIAETVETVQGIFLRRKDPVRNTANPFMMFWLCLNRARLQIYRNQRQFLYDQLLHLGCGLFISIAASRFDYLGRQPDLVCAMTPFQLKSNCANPTDHLTEVGVFIALGVCFAGISVGSMTFGNEKIVYWREKSSGLLTLPYYIAKVIADIPRIVLAGIMFSISLIIFFNQRSNYFYLLCIIVMLYAVAFAMGYFLSALVPQNRVSLVGTGFTLAWAIVFSGDAPDLAEVMSDDAAGGYKATSWIWVISAPRYAIEAIYLREIQARPWQEIRNEPLSHTYQLDQFWWCFQSMIAILLGWHVLAFFSLKLKDRSKQK
ncbi:hypothetical protein BX616_008868 [Lobosporangium transversale]|uniref:ABC transporter domain-containing protein n=1 Tax=Lobosporangium transversale TaxID=64571 RepID=A0A1Y2GYV5_9FUNG|nr:hypothetical protein BCR41DRAFT_419248 [Lobosporangium transversale]KAF9918428.1 hypothetical protein BX616_008868 [Lobosporangium transversale]ORZ27488.1 hypothetical protein BCR41DRAFT_419248 [Lobosporangium transversale]|eukprot:XP_021885215.1 hypothetical protein BCR41DRAFT_419248 [Lobosporangium transversale]